MVFSSRYVGGWMLKEQLLYYYGCTIANFVWCGTKENLHLLWVEIEYILHTILYWYCVLALSLSADMGATWEHVWISFVYVCYVHMGIEKTPERSSCWHASPPCIHPHVKILYATLQSHAITTFRYDMTRADLEVFFVCISRFRFAAFYWNFHNIQIA